MDASDLPIKHSVMANHCGFFILGFLLLGAPLQSHAVLGERGQSTSAIKSLVTPSNNTVRYQASQDDVVAIKEYVDSSGMVYAIRWEGPRPPDLDTLLGRYLSEYKMAVVATPFRVPRRRLMADSDNLHISQFGHPGYIFGIVYLKGQLPTNVYPEDLK